MAKNNPAAKNKKGKGRGPEQPAPAQPTAEAMAHPAAVPAVVALHPSNQPVHPQSPITHAENGHDGAWSQTLHDADGDHGDDAWGEGAAASTEYWGPPTGVAEQPSANDDDAWGAPSGGAFGSPVPASGEWGAPAQPAPVSGWGQPPIPPGPGAFGTSRGRGGARVNAQPPTPPVARAPGTLGLTSFHPSPAAQMSPAQGWGPPPATSGWGDPPTTWGQPAAPRPPPPPASKPAWTNWAREAKMVNIPPATVAAPYPYTTQNAAVDVRTRRVLSEQQRSQLLSSLLDLPGQQTKGYSPQSHSQSAQQSRQQSAHQPSRSQPQAFHPVQHPGYMDPQIVTEQQSILRSIQEQNTRGNGHHSHQRSQPVQHADSWDRWQNEGWGGDRASTIPEEDEEYEDDGWGDHEDDGWGQSHGNQRVRFSPNVDYASQSQPSITHAPVPTSTPAHPPPHTVNHVPTYAPPPASVTSSSRHGTQRSSHIWMPSPNTSRTMRMATGTLPTPNGTMKTTIFELLPPRNELGEHAFIDSWGDALRPAERALYNRDRPAKERFRWGFNPEKDQRVGSLLRWVADMSGGLAGIGLQRFLDTRERGALFANADYRVPSSAGEAAQPAFDWVPLSILQETLDSTLQSSVTLYDPEDQVIVFVFLLSPSGNSMALWRRKLSVPETLREKYGDEIAEIKAELKRSYPVYVDELPVKPEQATPSKKKVRFAFIRRLFGRKKKVAAAA